MVSHFFRFRRRKGRKGGFDGYGDVDDVDHCLCRRAQVLELFWCRIEEVESC